MNSKRLIFPLAFLSVSCSKPEWTAGYEGYEDHPTWTDSNPEAFWDKQPDGLRLDTVWDGDTTINF
ncbi:MAG: hypothetical protein IKP34_06800 [Bacteroidales bacterium]|nr:hypothetical protein [Bacteroidales bacterium]